MFFRRNISLHLLREPFGRPLGLPLGLSRAGLMMSKRGERITLERLPLRIS